jgi:subtilisin family serine protease
MKRLTVVFGVLAILASMAGTAGAADPVGVPDEVAAQVQAAKQARTYLVLLEGDPVVSYKGDIPGLPATQPERGRKVDRNSPAVRQYVAHLEADQNQELAAAGAEPADKIYSFTFAANGFAATLTPGEVTALASSPDVLAVVPDERRQLLTDSSPGFLGLDDRQGPWAAGYTGEDIIIGMIDTGIWPEHPSFADDGSYGPAPAGFTGTGCDFGNTAFNPEDAAFTCNNKLLAAKSYSAGFLATSSLAPGSFLSTRDENGHGTHTSSTAGGNSDVAASILGADYGTIAGIAPRARLSVYKACWSETTEIGFCALSDLVAAIDDGVADGVDVISYSIGALTFTIGGDDIAFLFADNAGVFVSAAAGNDGPGAETTGSPANTPWLTGVGASTQLRDFRGTVTLGNGDSFEGVTVTGGLPSTPLVDAADLGNTLCDPGVTFTGDITGKVVLCERGVVARVAKSQAVFQQGGAGMILFNPSPNTLNTDNHYVPSIHVDEVAGAAIKAYIDSAGMGATAELSGGQKVNAQANVMATFSSRGPNGLSPDIIKPDVTAPGVNILAGGSPAALLGAPDQLFQAISGTSMSTPHVSGVFALIKQAHPDWTPAMARSALMTTARQNVVKENGSTPADPFDFGSGHIAPGGNIRPPNNPFDPGLVYDAGFLNYLGYLCEVDPDLLSPTTCPALEGLGVPITAENLNYPSIGISDVVGSATVTRTITSVALNTAVYHANVEAPGGFTVTVSPNLIKLAPGESASFEVTVTNTGAPAAQWRFGSLSWKGGGYTVTSPLAVQAFAFDAPDEIDATGTAGTVSFEVRFGYTGEYTAAPHGPVPATLSPDTVVDDPDNDINVALNCWFAAGGTLTTSTPASEACGLTLHVLSVAGSAHTRVSLFDDFVDGTDDLDMFVFTTAGAFVGQSAGPTAEEQVDLPMPADGTYAVFVHGFETDGPDSNYTLFDWSVPLTPGTGALTVDSAPASAVLGTTGTVEASWSGLSASTHYLGAVSHSDASGVIAITLIDIVS